MDDDDDSSQKKPFKRLLNQRLLPLSSFLLTFHFSPSDPSTTQREDRPLLQSLLTSLNDNTSPILLPLWATFNPTNTQSPATSSHDQQLPTLAFGLLTLLGVTRATS